MTKSRAKRRRLTHAVIVVVALVGGWLLRDLTRDQWVAGKGGALGEGAEREAQRSTRKLVALSVRTSQFQETLARERRFESMDPSEFPGLIEAELEAGKSSEKIFEIARRWIEKDPDGYLSWLREQPDRFIMREKGHDLGLAHTLVWAIQKTDPKRAWKLAGDLSGSHPNHMQFQTLLETLDSDPDLALEIVRENHLELSLEGNGYWGKDPMKTVSVLRELIPGPGQKRLMFESISVFANQGESPESLAKAKSWFGQLNPQLQDAVLRMANEGTFVTTPSEGLLEAWTRDH